MKGGACAASVSLAASTVEVPVEGIVSTFVSSGTRGLCCSHAADDRHAQGRIMLTGASTMLSFFGSMLVVGGIPSALGPGASPTGASPTGASAAGGVAASNPSTTSAHMAAIDRSSAGMAAQSDTQSATNTLTLATLV